MSKSTGSARFWERVLPIKGNLSLDSSTKFCFSDGTVENSVLYEHWGFVHDLVDGDQFYEEGSYEIEGTIRGLCDKDMAFYSKTGEDINASDPRW